MEPMGNYQVLESRGQHLVFAKKFGDYSQMRR